METVSFPDSSAQCLASDSDLQERIRRRAEEIYFRNGQIPGRDVENWKQAEQEIQREMGSAKIRTAIVVQVNGVRYVGVYQQSMSDGYTPGEFHPGTSVSVRMDGDRMFVKRPNGKELVTTIVEKTC